MHTSTKSRDGCSYLHGLLGVVTRCSAFTTQSSLHRDYVLFAVCNFFFFFSAAEQINKCGGQSDVETSRRFALQSFHTFTAHVVDFCVFTGTADAWRALTSSSLTGLANLEEAALDVSPHASPLFMHGSTCTSSGLGI